MAGVGVNDAQRGAWRSEDDNLLAMTRRAARGRATWAVVCAGGLTLASLLSIPVAGAASTCGSMSVSVLDANLGIDATHVSAAHPASPVGALICSYFGNSGRTANEATVNYLPATAKAFATFEASLANSHRIRTINGIKSAAYSYEVGSERYLYVLDGTKQVQMFAATPLSKLEALARAMPVL